MDKYELLSGEDLDLKPSTVEQAKFEYSPLGKVFNKGLSAEDKKEGLFKRLENIKGKNEELINTLSTTNKAPKNKTTNQQNIKIWSKSQFYREILTRLKNYHLILCLAKWKSISKDFID